MKIIGKKLLAILLCVLTVVQLSVQFASAWDIDNSFSDLGEGSCFPNILGDNTDRWATTKKSFMYEHEGKYYIVDITNQVNVTVYDRNFNEIFGAGYTFPFELPVWGGFYSGKNYNYIVYGKENPDKCPNDEVYRIVKYDKKFKRIEALTIDGYHCETVIPFAAGTVAMAENTDGSELTVHTSRERFDGHQSQFTIIIDTKTMMVKNELQEFQNNHVSHSFNQFVQYDGNTPVLVDHGDGYPRSVVLSKRRADGKYSQLSLFDIPGKVGANHTGVYVGGLELSANNYIVSINSIDHSKVTFYDSGKMHGLDTDERNAVLLISAKNNTDPSKVKKVYLTDYINKGLSATAPYLVKINDNKFVAMWKEFKPLEAVEYDGFKWWEYEEKDVKFVVVDENGKMLSKVQSIGTKCNLSDCQPIYSNGKIIWYYQPENGERNICALDIDAVSKPETGTPGDVNLDGKINTTDALLALQHSVKKVTLTGQKLTNADVNKDNKVNTTDALKILQYSVGKIDKF